ncbi:sensor histidine kinase, partial [Pseudoalteromonas phenolica]
LKQLKRSFKAIESGELDTRLALKRHDEVGEIISSFNNLAAWLQGLHQQYKQMNSDLSHELRTPLNGIRSRL